MMKQGLILEVQEKHWIVLTPDGDFLKVPRTNLQAEAGEEVFFQEERKGFGSRVWFSALSAAAAAMLGIFFVYPQFVSNPAKAETYVYLDINPSMAIGLDEGRNVVEVKPLNKSAKEVIRETDWKNEYVGDFVVEVLETAQKKGYVHPKDQVVLSGFEEQKAQTALKDLEKEIKQEIRKEHLSLDIHTLTIPTKVKSSAEQTGLSPAKYAAWLVANKEGQELSVEKVEETSIAELAETIEPVSKLLEKPPTDTEWNEIIQNAPADPAPAAAPNPDAQEQNQPATDAGTGNGPSSGTTEEPAGNTAPGEPAQETPADHTTPADAQDGNIQSQQTEGSSQTQGDPVSP